MKSFHLATLYRKDRDSGYGGMFIACKSNIQCKPIEMLTECELVACEVLSTHGPQLVIISMYHPAPYFTYIRFLAAYQWDSMEPFALPPLISIIIIIIVFPKKVNKQVH